jgi:hypothetical protein
MSIFVESLTVVVRRLTLDVSWSGGADAYLTTALSQGSLASLVCTDDELTAVSFASAGGCDVWLDRLADCGIVHVDDKRSADVVCIDELSGPRTPCDWIEWRQHPDGFTYAWLAGTDPGDVVAPTMRRREEARWHRPRAEEVESGHMIQLASENGLDYWLDLHTGRQIVALSQPPAPGTSEQPSPPAQSDRAPLLPIVLEAMERIEWKPEDVDDTTIFIRVRAHRFLFTLGVCVDDATRTVACYGHLPVHVDSGQRLKVAEAIVRINQGLHIGCFDLDFDDGEVRFRVGCDVEGGALTHHMALTMFGAVSGAIDRYGPALMSVIFGQVSPEDAAHKALSSESPSDE